MNAGLVYYTDNQCEERISNAVRDRLARLCVGMEIVSVSHAPIDFGKNIEMLLPRSAESIIRQIYAGLQASTADIVFLVEHDVLYHPSHFEFIPTKKHMFYYNQNRWQVDAVTGQAVFRYTRATSHLVSYREELLKHFKNLLETIDKVGWSPKIGVAPGTHRENHHSTRTFMSEYPNVDIRHSNNYTPNSNVMEDYSRHSRKGWLLADEGPGWGVSKNRFDDFLTEVSGESNG
jgi:hypothetical protein